MAQFPLEKAAEPTAIKAPNNSICSTFPANINRIAPTALSPAPTIINGVRPTRSAAQPAIGADKTVRRDKTAKAVPACWAALPER